MLITLFTAFESLTRLFFICCHLNFTITFVAQQHTHKKKTSAIFFCLDANKMLQFQQIACTFCMEYDFFCRSQPFDCRLTFIFRRGYLSICVDVKYLPWIKMETLICIEIVFSFALHPPDWMKESDGRTNGKKRNEWSSVANIRLQ